jgi:serine/threonine protein kinase/tetratricopeptide (TPR) repeat protein
MWDRVEEIFHRALAIPAEERPSFLARACDGDAEVRRLVESLLAHNGRETGDFAAPLQSVAADVLTGIRPGTMMGPYRIDRKIGEGGMGSVYLASDTRLGRSVAVKVISRTLARTEDARARFLREARSAAALSHPNIATLHDVGESGGSPWLVMEYVDGTPLRSKLTGAIGESALLRYAAEIAGALEHAHARRIIHRDIKPENILLSGDDHVKIIDFGLARAAMDEPSTSAMITDAHAFIGTLAYAAPELLSGGSPSARSDVYSAGVVLYEMACGEPPFATLTGPALVAAVLAGSYVECKLRNPAVSASLSAVIDRCMSREPAARYKDGAALAAALREVESGAVRAPEHSPPTLAVIDFRNIGGAADLEWLGTGMAETLSADLTKLGSVRVASRSRVVQILRRMGGTQHDEGSAMELGRELGARWIVTGGFQQMGDRIRVTASLVDARSGDALSTEKIDGRWADLFDVQDRVVGALLKALTIGFGTTDQKKILPAETRSLAAYEHYVRARREMYRMDSSSLTTAIRHFEQAVAVDPDYALAYSGMGTAHALQFIRTTNPEDIAKASGYLERAIELDPELGEPYPWLANIRIRKNDPHGAIEAGRRGVELQPDLPDAHYFYGGCFYMVPEYRPGAVRESPAFLREALRLQPRMHAAWLGLGASLAFVGRHAEAVRALEEGVRLEGEPEVYYRFVGARSLLGFAHTRTGEFDTARKWHSNSLEALRGTDHIYTSSFQTLSACGLGEVELRSGDAAAALAHFRHARRVIQESPRTVGSARLMIRINAGMSASYAATGDVARARELADEARRQIKAIEGQTATATFECSFAQLWLILAAVELRLGESDRAIACLLKAREMGWMDAVWLRLDPELEGLRMSSEWEDFVRDLEAAAPGATPAG